MRRSILLYLFVFTALIAVFEYVTSKNMIDSKDDEIAHLKQELEDYDQNRESSVDSASELFRLQGNDEAVTYLEKSGYKMEEVEQAIEEEIIGRNMASEDNNLVPYKGMAGPMRIKKIRVLNHKWILADFTDGSQLGELFITYYFGENGKLILETENSLLYPKE